MLIHNGNRIEGPNCDVKPRAVHQRHEELEDGLASFLGSEAALLFSTGYMANLGVITTLAEPGDVVVSDSLNHASIIDGIRLSGCEKRIFRHNDPEDFARLAADLVGFRRRILVVDGIYSMDGDVAPLHELIPIAHEHDMIVVVDDTHGFGVLGQGGRGTLEHEGVEADVHIANLGKALGSFGAFVACSFTTRQLLINRSRQFIFTCSLPPAAVGAAKEALRIVKAEPARRRTLLGHASRLRQGLKGDGYDTGFSSTHIVPLILGNNELTMELSEAALTAGVFVQGIRPPSVPPDTSRLRFTPTSGHTSEDLETVIEVFRDLQVSGREPSHNE